MCGSNGGGHATRAKPRASKNRCFRDGRCCIQGESSYTTAPISLIKRYL